MKTLIVSGIDGVLVDFIGGLIKQLWDKFGFLMQYEDFTSHVNTIGCIYDKLNLVDGSYSYVEIEEFFKKIILSPDFISNLSPFYRYLDILQRLIENKYRMDCNDLNCSYVIKFLSNRHVSLFDCTFSYLSNWDLDADFYLCESKEKFINNLLEFDYNEIIVIEDNVNAVKGIMNDRVHILIRKQPYNGHKSDVWHLYKENRNLIRLSEDLIISRLEKLLV
jgi:hypothetical protein